MGLPPGVQIGDLIQENESKVTIEQAYILATQVNQISDYLKRFDTVRVPDGCQSLVNAQINKLKSLQIIIWNTMISMAVGNVTIEDSVFQNLMEKRAGETLSLIEIEKVATAIKTDTNVDWIADIEKVISSVSPSVLESIESASTCEGEVPILSQPERQGLPGTTPTNQLISQPLRAPVHLPQQDPSNTGVCVNEVLFG